MTPVLLVDDAAENTTSPDRRVERDHHGGAMLRRTLAQALMRATAVDMRDVPVEDLPCAALYSNRTDTGASSVADDGAGQLASASTWVAMRS